MEPAPDFQVLPTIGNADHYLDVAFRAAKDATDMMRTGLGRKTRLDKSKQIEGQRISKVNHTLQRMLNKILETFPSFDRLPPFYNALVKATVDYGMLKQSLGAVQWAAEQSGRLAGAHIAEIRRAQKMEQVNPIRTQYYGRVASVIKQINKNFLYLEDCRRTMKRYPVIKNLPTIVIAGYPNVGKTTLLKALTGSAPEIAPYPFTTQELMLGYFEYEGTKYQVIDTPGLLDRPLSDRKPAEVHAILALTHLASLIIFLTDPTETCGYTLLDQDKLLASIKKEFKQPGIIVANKADLEERPSTKGVLHVSAETGKGIDLLKKKIQEKALKEEKKELNSES